MTSLTRNEFWPLVPPFEAAFQTHLAEWRLDGQPRTSRRYTTDHHGPLPTPEARLLYILADLTTSPRQVVQGRLFGRGQSTAQPWIHVLVVVRHATLRARGDAPTRSMTAWAQRLGGAEAQAAVVAPTTATPPAAVPAPVPASPLLGTRGLNGAWGAPRTRLSRRALRAARTHATR